MKVKELLDEIDEQKPNKYTQENKLRWLSVCERKLIDSVILKHAMPQDIIDRWASFTKYTDSDLSKELLAEDAYCDLYKYYIYAMIDSTNGETKRYEGSMQLYNMMLKDYADLINRNYMPIQNSMRW